MSRGGFWISQNIFFLGFCCAKAIGTGELKGVVERSERKERGEEVERDIVP